MEPTENDPITRRLHSLGDQPIDPEVASRHRSLIAAVPVASSRSRLRPLMIGSLLAGSLLGGMGLAAAAPGVPDSASDVAKNVLATVTLGAVDRPNRGEAADDAKDAAEEAKEAAEAAKEAREEADEPKAAHADDDHGVTRSYADCPLPGDKTGTHGQYVSSVEDDPATTTVNERQVAAQSDCGKPDNSSRPPHEDNANKPANPGRSNEDPGQGEGRPEGAPGKSGEERPDADDNPGSSNRPATAGKSGNAPGADD